LRETRLLPNLPALARQVRRRRMIARVKESRPEKMTCVLGAPLVKKAPLRSSLGSVTHGSLNEVIAPDNNPLWLSARNRFADAYP